MKYVRIGTDYYKKSKMPLLSGDTINVLLKWRKSEIIQDEGKEILNEIKKYDGFCTIPSNTNHQESVNGYYNKYEKLIHEFKPGEFQETTHFLKHIFGKHYDLGLDYLTILWQKPTQILPILCLVSKERNTGKTTFLNFLKLIFQVNMTINKNEDFRSQFNSDWVSKLIIAVDEALLNKREDSERIKNLSTALNYKTESKGIDKQESSFFGKFILCSNNVDNFILIDEQEIRYWVLEVPSLTQSQDNPDLLEVLKKELPYFLYFLNNRKIKYPKMTRMWFTKEQIYTKALTRLVKGNRTYLNRELEEILIDDFIKFEVDTLKYTLGDLIEKLSKNNIRANSSSIREKLKSNFGIESHNGSYTKYHLNQTSNGKFTVGETQHKGRYFTFSKNDYIKIDENC
ncbi:MAG: helicase [Algicola sp.]|nr:helicase [Algicola sp.]